MKTMAFKVIGDLLLAVHGAQSMTEEEAGACFEAVAKVDIRRAKSLVFTKGGGPKPGHRKVLADMYKGRSVPTAVISDVRLVRGIVTAMAWFNPSMRAFASSGVQDALKFLDVPESQWSTILREAEKLKRELEAAPLDNATA
jgi:hypothetical protein